jgi:pyridoxamine 5'-phosphate oxidase
MHFTEYSDPFELFAHWLEKAKSTASIAEPTAMSLATATKDGAPSVRIVLLKQFDTRGFTLYTNLESRKSREIKANPNAALCFYWMPLDKQVRVEGVFEAVSNEEADAYYGSRPLLSRIGAWASDQSRPLDSRETLARRVADLRGKYTEKNPPPRPPHWSGWRLVPHTMEFWHQGDFRLHDRIVFKKNASEWIKQRLYP